MKITRNKYIIMILLILISGLVILFHKTYLSFDLVCKVDSEIEFRPDAYVVINSEEKLKDFLFLRKEVKLCSDSFDLSRFTYIVVYGKQVNIMYHSYKSTYFDDKSASYAPHWNSKVLFIEYDNKPSEKKMFVYKISKEDKLRGFFGI